MNIELLYELDGYLQQRQLDKAIAVAEDALRQLPAGKFKVLLGRNMLHMADKLASYLYHFYRKSDNYFKTKTGIETERYYQVNPTTFEQEEVERVINWDDKKLKAIYCEMNAFTINCDTWYLDFFAYSIDKGTEDIDWLAEFEYSTENTFTVTGFEELQMAYENYMKKEEWRQKGLKQVADICELLIILRLQQLFVQAIDLIRQRHSDFATIPVYVTAHEYDLIYNAAG